MMFTAEPTIYFKECKNKTEKVYLLDAQGRSKEISMDEASEKIKAGVKIKQPFWV